MSAGTGIFFDGLTSARQEVAVELAPHALVVKAQGGPILAEWPYDELEEMSAPDRILRLGRRRNPVLARLEIHDAAFAAEVDRLALEVDRTGARSRRARMRVVVWSVGGMLSLLVVGIFGLPQIASRLAPLVPYALERRLGHAVDAQIRTMLDGKNAGAAFECAANADPQAREALAALVRRLETAAALPMPLDVAVIRRPEANAIALPGGRIYVFEGLIDKANRADELAGVLAHEIGHVAHRDGTRSVIQSAGLALLFGMLLGDFVGGGAVVIGAKTLMQSAYSRDVEMAADLYAADLMIRLGADPRALGSILGRLTNGIEPGMSILLDHPLTKDRVAAIDAAARAAAARAGPPLLDDAGFAALKRICGRA